ncbi:hypothetical protein AUJ14_00825 [Candidatus Micrarchaeota archaeon CG1_02_55_22]|nr:MAG: hypothetical protein AUJ14_00825 [Candidatus Micrarchaeota archaeon CG1_02_55_22]
MDIKIEPCEGVYAPEEDSLLLAGAAARHAHCRILDLGCGTGLAGITAALKPEVNEVVFADINPLAIACSRGNAQRNGVLAKASFTESDLFNNLEGKFDTIMFNPPYLPTAQDEHVKGLLDEAFDGGPDGRAVSDLFIKTVANFLNHNGIILLVSSSLASSEEDGKGNEETKKKLEDQGFAVEEIGRESFFFEKLVVLLARKN